MLKDLKAFLMKGNIVDLAVAVVVGAAFGAVVTSLVENIITPLIGIPGGTDFSSLTFTINGSTFFYGLFLNSLISFLSIATAVFFIVVKPMEAVTARMAKVEEATTKECPECLSEIPLAARRCAHCTSQQPAAP